MDKNQLQGIKTYLSQIKDRNYSQVFPPHFERDMHWLVEACELLVKEHEKVSDNPGSPRTS